MILITAPTQHNNEWYEYAVFFEMFEAQKFYNFDWDNMSVDMVPATTIKPEFEEWMNENVTWTETFACIYLKDDADMAAFKMKWM